MTQLSPTLWRTCKMLAGHTRMHLLRELFEQPGRNVSELGQAVGVQRSDASQELRRIQSRGLLRSQRQGRPLIYRMESDPLVSSAAPLLKAIQSALANLPAARDRDLCVVANGLAHERRIAIVEVLLNGPQTIAELQQRLHLTPTPLRHHLTTLKTGGFALIRNNQIHLNIPAHPVARTLIKLIRKRRE